MSPLFYNLIIIFGTIIFWIGFAATLAGINPEQGGGAAVLLFFINLFFALTGTIYLISYVIRLKIFGKSALYRNIQVSTRQAGLFAILISSTLWLQSQRLLTWYNVILLILGLTVLEFFFISRQSRARY